MNQSNVTASGRHSSASGSADDVWYVKLPDGDALRLSLDELDAAFNAGTINESTPVLPAGAFQWTTLGKAAGLDDTPAPVSMPNSIAPMALDHPSARGVDVDVVLDADSNADVDAFRPRRGRTLLRFAIVAAVIGGLSFGGLHAQRALAARADASRAAAVAAAFPPPPVVAPLPVVAAPPPVVEAAPVPPPAAQAPTDKADKADKAKDKGGKASALEAGKPKRPAGKRAK